MAPRQQLLLHHNVKNKQEEDEEVLGGGEEEDDETQQQVAASSEAAVAATSGISLQETTTTKNDDESSIVCSSTSSSSSSSWSSSMIASTFALCLCMLTHSYLLISVFPYSGFLAIQFLPDRYGVTPETAGSYAGLVAASFMMGRAMTAYAWGQAADRYGRTAVLILSLCLSSVLSICFGLATNFYVALLCRFAMGASNGIMGTIKTIVSDLASAHNNEKLETTMMATVIGLWGWGFLFSPAISGWLAEPVKQYPDLAWLQQPGGVWHTVLTRHPFLLPNLLGATLCLVGAATILCFVKETLPKSRRRNPRWMLSDLIKYCQSCCCSGGARLFNNQRRRRRYQRLPILKAHDSGHFAPDDLPDNDEVEDEDEADDTARITVPAETTTTMAILWARPQTRTCLSIYWAYSFVGLTVDETFPLFCISQEAGFGLVEKNIGKILSLCGLIFALAQYCVYGSVYNRFGLYGSIRVGSMLSAPMMFFVPLSRLINNRGANNKEGELRQRTFVFLACMLAMHRLFALVFFSSISVATNRTVPTMQRAALNGLSVMGGSAAKALGPVFAGFLVSSSVSLLHSYASVLIFGIIGCLGCCVSLSTFLILKEDEGQTEEDDDGTEESDIERIELTDRVTKS